jgi:hypothetical protein
VAWLCLIVPYFIVNRKKKIISIPLSMCVWLFVISFGPWGMFAVSENSQVGRLKELLIKNHILVDGRVQSEHDSVTFEATKQISSVISYLSEMHGFDAIQPWFGESLKDDLVGKASAHKDPARVARLMGIEYVRVWQASSGGMIVFTADRDGSLAIDGYDRLLRGLHVYSGVPKKEPSEGGISYRIGKELSRMTIDVSRLGKVVDSLDVDLQPLVNRLLADYGNAITDRIPPEKMVVTVATRMTKVKVCLSAIRLQRHGVEAKVLSYEGDIVWVENKMP